AVVVRDRGGTDELGGRLRHIPHAEGFPGLDKSHHGLAPLHVVERLGLVFIWQRRRAQQFELAGIRELVGKDQKLYATSERVTAANWKIVLEGFLEGYHI